MQELNMDMGPDTSMETLQTTKSVLVPTRKQHHALVKLKFCKLIKLLELKTIDLMELLACHQEALRNL
jgi:hypothetical protein